MNYCARGRIGRLFALIIAKFSGAVTCWLLCALPAWSAEPPLKAVATIRPLYSLLASITEGVFEPTLLIKHQASPHHYALKPSEKRRLKEADLIFWIGPTLETFLPKLLDTLPSTQTVVRVDESPGLLRLTVRTGRNWAEANHDPQHNHAHHHETGALDPHIWLSPSNAIPIAAYMTKKLIQRDPGHQSIYESNLKKLKKRLVALNIEIAGRLKQSINKPFMVFHDGYQYFEHAYDLKGLGAIALNPELPMGSRRFAQVQNKIQSQGVQCVFSEPQWNSQLVDKLSQKYNIKVRTIDPLGKATGKASEDYFSNMRALTDTVIDCLSP